ncbi:MAG TPA: ABC transporter permease [Anaerolineae bacterium]|nr:ABC transporter permease [Anaerolineae bacterium]
MKTFANLYIAELKEYIRDRMAVFWTIAFPLLFIFLFGMIFSGGDSGFSMQVGLVARGSDPASAGLVMGFRQVPVFELTESADLESELAALRAGDRDMVVVLPDDLSQSVAGGQSATVEVYYDPSSTTTSQAGLSILNEMFNEAERRIRQTPQLFKLEPKQIQSTPLRNIDFLVPGILAMSLMQIGLFATAQPLVSMREQGVLRRLGATPLSRQVVLASQVAFRLTIGLVQTAIILSLGNLVFGVAIGDNLPLLIVIVILGMLLFVAIGFAIAGIAKSSESAAGISQLVNFPMMFLSGLFFPVSIMPAFLQPVTAVIPLTYVADALRQVMVGAPPVNLMSTNLLLMAGWLVVSIFLAVKLFKWE